MTGARVAVYTFIVFFLALGLFLILGGQFSLTALLLIGAAVLTVGAVSSRLLRHR